MRAAHLTSILTFLTPIIIVFFLTTPTSAARTTATSFCKCICFNNSTIIALNPPSNSNQESDASDDSSDSSGRKSHRPLDCSACNRAFCLDYNLPICKNAREEDIFTTCFSMYILTRMCCSLKVLLMMMLLSNTRTRFRQRWNSRRYFPIDDHWAARLGSVEAVVWDAEEERKQRSIYTKSKLASARAQAGGWWGLRCEQTYKICGYVVQIYREGKWNTRTRLLIRGVMLWACTGTKRKRHILQRTFPILVWKFPSENETPQGINAMSDYRLDDKSGQTTSILSISPAEMRLGLLVQLPIIALLKPITFYRTPNTNLDAENRWNN